MNVFEEVHNRLEYFIRNNLCSYHELRNYDYGIKDRSNVSQISKYTSHRILNEYDVIKRLNTVDKKKNLQMKFFGGFIGKDTLKITNQYGLNIKILKEFPLIQVSLSKQEREGEVYNVLIPG